MEELMHQKWIQGQPGHFSGAVWQHDEYWRGLGQVTLAPEVQG